MLHVKSWSFKKLAWLEGHLQRCRPWRRPRQPKVVAREEFINKNPVFIMFFT